MKGDWCCGMCRCFNRPAGLVGPGCSPAAAAVAPTGTARYSGCQSSCQRNGCLVLRGPRSDGSKESNMHDGAASGVLQPVTYHVQAAQETHMCNPPNEAGLRLVLVTTVQTVQITAQHWGPKKLRRTRTVRTLRTCCLINHTPQHRLPAIVHAPVPTWPRCTTEAPEHHMQRCRSAGRCGCLLCTCKHPWCARCRKLQAPAP
jgi:hypothetical protein